MSKPIPNYSQILTLSPDIVLLICRKCTRDYVTSCNKSDFARNKEHRYEDKLNVWHSDRKCRNKYNRINKKHGESLFNSNIGGCNFTFHKIEGEPNDIPYYGIEVELEYYKDSSAEHSLPTIHDIFDKFGYKTNRDIEYRCDSSLDNGIEISTHIFSMRYHKEIFKWQKLFDLLKREYKTHYTAGVHIHSSNLFNGKWKIYFYCIFLAYNEKLSYHIAKREQGDHRTYPLKCNLSHAAIHGNSFVSVDNHGEIETRIFNSTLDVKVLYSYLEYIDSLGKFINSCEKGEINSLANELILKHKEDIIAKTQECDCRYCQDKFIYNNKDNEIFYDAYIDYVRRNIKNYRSLNSVIDKFVTPIKTEVK